MTRILITGANGFIGSHLAEALLEKKHQLRCLIRKTSDLVWIKDLPVEFVYGDLLDLEALRAAVEGVDTVYHLAGVTSAKTKEGYYRGNHLATKNLLDAVLAFNPGLRRFVHVSSQAAVGPSLGSGPVDETTPFHPITTYGITKMEAEKECLRRMDRLPITIARPPAVYGPRDDDVFEFFNTMSKGLQPMIGFNNKEVSLIHVKDLVGGIIAAGEHPNAAGQTYFISSERYYDWKTIGSVTAKIMGRSVLRLRVPVSGVYLIAAFSELYGLVSRKPVLINFEKARDIVQDAWTCSIAKAQKELSFRESFTLETGIRNTVEWYKREGWI
jgi:dihydroflavonol-4-reductase